MSLRLVAFLGNPGREYEGTRHNIGWQVASSLSFHQDLVWRKKYKGLFAQHVLGGHSVLFLKPLTFMNRSGESVSAAVSFYRIDPQEVLVVHDEVELDFGEVDSRRGGGLAGHKGLRSIAMHLGTRDFYRFRIGISKPTAGSVSSHVLGKFSAKNGREELGLARLIEGAARLIEEGMGQSDGSRLVALGRMRLLD